MITVRVLEPSDDAWKRAALERAWGDTAARSRQVKPSIPVVNTRGVPIRDELEFEWRERQSDP